MKLWFISDEMMKKMSVSSRSVCVCISRIQVHHQWVFKKVLSDRQVTVSNDWNLFSITCQSKILDHDNVNYLKKILGELAMVLDQVEAELEKRKLEYQGEILSSHKQVQSIPFVFPRQHFLSFLTPCRSKVRVVAMWTWIYASWYLPRSLVAQAQVLGTF